MLFLDRSAKCLPIITCPEHLVLLGIYIFDYNAVEACALQSVECGFMIAILMAWLHSLNSSGATGNCHRGSVAYL